MNDPHYATTKLLMITHEQVGPALLNTVKQTLGKIPLPTTIIAVKPDSDPQALLEEIQLIAQQLPDSQGLLVLTDLYGSTPSNLATCLRQPNIRVIAGLNLPMLIRVMNYAHLALADLANKALTGGRDGIISCSELAHA